MTEDKKPQDAQKVQEAQKAQEPKPARKARKKPAAAAAQKEQKATKRSRARKAKEEPHEPGRELTRGEQLLIIAAANKSGRDAAKVELSEALAIMEIEPADSSEAGIAAAVDQYWQNISIGQLEEMLKTSGNDGKLFKGYLLAYLGESADTAETPAESLLNHIAEISARDATLQTSFAGIYVEAQEMLHRIADTLQTAAKSTDLAAEARESIAKLTQEVQETLQAASKVDVVGQLHNLFQNLQLFGEITGRVDLKQLQSNLEAAQALFPYFEKAFKEAQDADPEKYAGITAAQIFDLLTLDGTEAPEEFAPLIERAWHLKEIAERPMLQSIHPARHISQNTAIINRLADATRDNIIDGTGYDILVLPATKTRSEITAFVTVTDEKAVGISQHLSEADRAKYDAACSIWVQAQKDGVTPAFTEDMLYKAMPGGGGRASSLQKEEIAAAMDRFMSLQADIDATAEMRARKLIGEKDKYTIKGHLLDLRKHTYRTKGGREVSAWVMIGEPMLLQYARETKQLVSVPARYLTITKVKKNPITGEYVITNESVPMNTQRQAMTNYMLRRIAVMKHDFTQAKDSLRKYEKQQKKDASLPKKTLADFRKQSDTILFDTLFKATEITTDDRNQTMLNRNFCFDVLDFWQASGYIAGYEKQVKGRAVTGIRIKHESLFSLPKK